MELSDQALKLLTTSGFDAEYFSNLAKCKSRMEAYELTEQLFISIFKKRRYSSFDSFRKTYNQRLIKKC